MDSLRSTGMGQFRTFSSTSERLDLIWQMGLASLNETNNELRLPPTVSEHLTKDDIAVLEGRLSEQLGGLPIISFRDLDMNVFRIIKVPEMHRSETSPASMSSPMSSTSASSTSTQTKLFDPQDRAYGKKSKVPRPPNAFILYRQKHHPQIKAQNSDLHNNDISVILGQQWKNESVEVRNKFKDLAEELKRQHHLKFPGYQYAPRRPAEKKRRLTTRKTTKVQNTLDSDTGNEMSDFPVPSNSDRIDMEYETTSLNMQGQVEFHQNSQANIFTSDRFFDDVNQPIPTSSNTPPNPNGMGSDYSSASLQQQVANASSVLATTPTDNIAFLNSLIDWEGLQEDYDLIKESVKTPEAREVAQIQGDHPYFGSFDEAERIAFEEELARTMDLFK